VLIGTMSRGLCGLVCPSRTWFLGTCNRFLYPRDPLYLNTCVPVALELFTQQAMGGIRQQRVLNHLTQRWRIISKLITGCQPHKVYGERFPVQGWTRDGC
jgi:hypothetical protein